MDLPLEVLRHSKDAWGQKMLVGVSWDLVWVPLGAAALVIIVHLVIRHRRGRSALVRQG